MAAVSSQGGTGCLNDSMIFSLLDQLWFSQSVLARCLATSVSAVESDILSRSSQADITRRSLEECSVSESVDDDHLKNCSTTLSETNRCYSVEEAELRRVFSRFDENEDGFISVEELGRHMSCCYGKAISDVDVASMILSVDRNNDGNVDFEEFLSLYEMSRCCSDDDAVEEDTSQNEEERDDLLKTFRVFDRNDDGLISAHELQTILLNLGMSEGKSLISCEKMIRNVDRDDDGHCNLREFQEMMSQSFFVTYESQRLNQKLTGKAP